MSIPVTRMSLTENVTLITLIAIPTSQRVLSSIFLSLSKKEINVDMISQTSPLKGTINLSFTIPDSDLFAAIQALKEFKSSIPSLRIEVNSNNTKISLFGEGMRTTPGTAARTMQLLCENSIDIVMITTSEVDISYLIYASDQDIATKLFRELIKE
ncbi:MAG: amino acid-binding protein [Firmicutes bacterium HGW-Firmicutes-1]|jgi:aspartokinase|nr:MAG: amino acid-binding protein [Firmicutes bacterium HGW-Firmicutes-1]